MNAFLHRPDDLGHVVKFLAILHLGPLVGTVRQVLIVVLAFVMICVEQVLEIVEPNDMAFLHSLSPAHRGKDQQGRQGQRNAVESSHRLSVIATTR